MKRYEYKLLFDRVTVAMGAQDFSDWVFKKLNEWGAEGWHIIQYNTPMWPVDRQGGQSLTGELVATGCRQLTEVAPALGAGFIGDTAEAGVGTPTSVVEGLPMGG